MRTLYPYIPVGFNYSDPYGVYEGNTPVLSQYHIIRLLCGGYHNLYMNAHSMTACDTPDLHLPALS